VRGNDNLNLLIKWIFGATKVSSDKCTGENLPNNKLNKNNLMWVLATSH
jgi:hypothetical protein